MSEEDPEVVQRFALGITSVIPHNAALGLELVGFDRVGGWVIMRLPYRAELIGNPETGVLHGGAITSMLDACSGGAVFVKRWSPEPIVTLDLRIDYLMPATPPRDVITKATCYKVTKNVAFVRAVAYHDVESDPIATAAGTFMLGTRGTFVGPKRSAT